MLLWNRVKASSFDSIASEVRLNLLGLSGSFVPLFNNLHPPALPKLPYNILDTLRSHCTKRCPNRTHKYSLCPVGLSMNTWNRDSRGPEAAPSALPDITVCKLPLGTAPPSSLGERRDGDARSHPCWCRGQGWMQTSP